MSTKAIRFLCVTSLAGAVALPFHSAIAQQGQKTLASTIDVFVFPKEGQDASQQSQAEAQCYDWAVNNSGSDPFELQKQSAQTQAQADAATQQAAESGRGAGARGAVGGAAAGAIVGEIADDDAGKGAAVGAAVGGISARRSAKKQEAAAQAQVEEQAQQSNANIAADTENFKKAFSACLEAKNYIVKY